MRSRLSLQRRVAHVAGCLGVCALAGGCDADPEAAPPSSAAATFTLITESPAGTDEASTGSGQWVDVDGDGDLDLFSANGYDVSTRGAPGQPDRLYLNDGRGGLTSVTDGAIVADTAPSSQATWGDYDNDGDEDAFVAVQQRRDNMLYRNEGGGRFTRITEGLPVQDGGLTFAASWVDVDRDGLLDLYASNGGLSGFDLSALYRNTGDGRFERAPANPFTTDSAVNAGGSWADYDNDGDPDLFIARFAARGAPTSALYRNDGDWRFTAVSDDPVVTDTSYALGGAWGDYDNDGDLDLAVAVQGGMANRLFRNEGGGRFTQILEGGPHVLDGGNSFGLTWADYDNDGDLDLLSINWGAPSFLYTNEGDGRFTRLAHGDLGSLVTRGAAASWGDYDGDGDLDVYIANWPDFPNGRQRNHLYRNDSPAGNHWLEVKLEGTRSNRSGIGARITLRARIRGREVTQIREVTGSTSFRSQDPVVQHFGLGDATAVIELVVRWPSGATQVVEGVGVDRRVGVREEGG